MNWLMMLAVLFVAANLVWGHKQGLLRVVFSLAGWVLVLAIVIFAEPHISTYLYEHTRIPQKIQEQCSEEMQRTIAEAVEERQQEVANLGDEADGIQKLGLMLPAVLLDKVLLDTGTYDELANNVSALAVKGICYLIALLIGLIGYWLLDKVVRVIEKVPVIGGLNRHLGVIAGAVKAILILWVALALTATFAGTDWGRFILSYVYDAPVLLWLYEHNFVLDIFTIWF